MCSNPSSRCCFSDAPLLAHQFVSRICAGFPSPAEDLGAQVFGLFNILTSHPQATCLMRARIYSMVEAGSFDNDILVLKRASKPSTTRSW